MRYTAILRGVDRRPARERLGRVDGVSSRRSRDADECVSPAGYRLAEFTDATPPDGNTGSRLRYRTAMLSPTATHARPKTQRIREAVGEFRVPDGRER